MARGSTIAEAAEQLSVSEQTLRNWRKRCPWLPKQRGIRHWPKTQIGSNELVYLSDADLQRIDEHRRGEPVTVLSSEDLLTAAEADEQLGIPKRLIHQWGRRGCPALNWPPPRPPAQWPRGLIRAVSKLKPAKPNAYRQAGLQIFTAKLFHRDKLLTIKEAYDPPDRQAAGFWPTKDEAFEIYGVQVSSDWTKDQCVWIDGRKLRWRNGRRPDGWFLYAVLEFDPVQLQAIADAQAAAERTAAQANAYQTPDQLAKRFERARGTMLSWGRRSWRILGGRKPRRREIRTIGTKGNPTPTFLADDFEAIATWLSSAEPLPDGWLTLNDAEVEFDTPSSTIGKSLNIHAPQSGRKILRRYGASTRRTTIYPRAAIKAALRGEHWQPATESATAPQQETGKGKSGGNGQASAAPATQPKKDARPGRRTVNADRDKWIRRVLKDRKTVARTRDALNADAVFVERFSTVTDGVVKGVRNRMNAGPRHRPGRNS